MKRATLLRFWAGTVLLLAIGIGAALAADEYPIQVYPCAKASGPVQLDGALPDPAWTNAVAVGGFSRYDHLQPARVQTLFRAIYDDRYLYVAVVCQEPLMSAVAPAVWTRDEIQLFNGEVVEVFRGFATRRSPRLLPNRG